MVLTQPAPPLRDPSGCLHDASAQAETRADRDGDDGRFKDEVNLADGLLNRLPTGLRPEFNICPPSGTEMPSLYAIPRDTQGMPSNPAQAEAFLLRSSQVTAGSPRVRPAGDAGPVAPISGKRHDRPVPATVRRDCERLR
jgi:hypothetical protein